MVAGDDAAELLERVHREFGTSLEGFDFETYFPNESDAMFYVFFLNWLGCLQKKSR